MKTLAAFGTGLVLLALGGAGCATESGSREFIPGKGWKSTEAHPVLAPSAATNPG